MTVENTKERRKSVDILHLFTYQTSEKSTLIFTLFMLHGIRNNDFFGSNISNELYFVNIIKFTSIDAIFLLKRTEKVCFLCENGQNHAEKFIFIGCCCEEFFIRRAYGLKIFLQINGYWIRNTKNVICFSPTERMHVYWFRVYVVVDVCVIFAILAEKFRIVVIGNNLIGISNIRAHAPHDISIS